MKAVRIVSNASRKPKNKAESTPRLLPSLSYQKLKRLILKLNPAICVLTPIVLLVQAVNALTPPIQLSALSMNRPDWLSPAKIKNPNIKIKKKPCKYCARVFYRKKKTNSAKRPITSAANKSAAAIAVKKSALIIFLKIVLPTIVFKNLGTQLTE